MSAVEELDLIALICSRLCHDLAGSIGAVNNGVELLAEETDPVMREEAIGLIAQSAGDAARRLAFFRLALGASGSTADPMAVAELSRIATQYFSGGKVSVALPETGTDLPKSLGKALLIGLLLSAQALPRGGNVQLAPQDAGWRITAQGAMLRWPDAVAAGLAQDTGWPREPLPALARYARLLTEGCGLKLTAAVSETELRLDYAG
ncbi:histidine phosphotransferase family protein [uncultured Ferrovibrio sp.]|jgi:histidine phosphotransferase ChpT|uniref:histidine phosphotransferase family protein n=1 Tax=uncultured Ferrovibrio sp. TaxID=1576913 RepID=UPI00260D2993|nr:histidine phosphotransferase family protein [uncultured Ferrovibrio sp.]